MPRAGALLALIGAQQSLCEAVQQRLDQRGLAGLPLPVNDPQVLRLHLPSLTDSAACDALRSELRPLAEEACADLCLLDAAAARPRRRLVAFDMDSTLIQCEVIDELAAMAGVREEVAAVTARAMRGELDFCSSFRERMAKLRGLPEARLVELREALPIMPGADELLPRLKALGHDTVLLSGGFDFFARRLQERFGLDEVHANRLHIDSGALTGEVEGAIVDGARKEALLGEIAARRGFAPEDTVAVGDGANDLPMLAAAGLGVAFHAKPLVRERATHAITHAPLDALLYLLDTPAAGN